MSQNTNNVSLFKVDSVSGFGQNNDGISGLIVLSEIATGSTLVNEQVYEFRSMRDAEGAGLVSAQGTEPMDLAYEHVREFFRFNPTGRIYFMISINGDTLSFSDVLSTGGNSLAKTMLKAAGGNITQLGVARVEALASQTAGAGVAQEVLDAIPVAQALVDDEFEPNKRPLSIAIEGHGWNGTVTAATDLRTLNSPDVAVVIGQDPAVSALDAAFVKHAAIGTFLGVSARGAVNESVGWVQNNNLLNAADGLFLDANLSDGNAASSVEADFDQLFQKGYTYIKKIAGLDGAYFVDAPTCNILTKMQAWWRHSRTLSKAARQIRTALLPNVNRPVDVDPATGQLAPQFISLFETEARSGLNAMVAAEEIEDFQVYIDPAQNVSANQTVEIQYEIVPKGVANAIKAFIALVPQLS